MTNVDFKNLENAVFSAHPADLPLSGDSMSLLNELIGKGAFKDKADFVQFVVKAYAQYKLSGGPSQPTQADVSKVIQNTGVGKGLDQADVEGKLLPLLTAAFTSAGKNKMGL